MGDELFPPRPEKRGARVRPLDPNPHAFIDAELGRRAAAMLFARLDGDDTPSREVVIAAQLIQRGSGELAAPAS